MKNNWILIGILCSIFTFFLFGIGFLSNLHLEDALHGNKQALNTIVIIAIDDASLQEIGRWPWNRSVFADTLTQLDGASVIGIDVAFFETTPDDSQVKEIFNKYPIVLPVEYTSFSTEGKNTIGEEMLHSVFDTKVGYVNIPTDADGVTRVVNTGVQGRFPSFSGAIYELFLNRQAPKNTFAINYVGGPGSFTTYSLKDIRNGTITPEKFTNKVVLIGATSPDLHDNYFVPTSKGKAMPGVEVHANILQMMITQRYLKTLNSWHLFILLLLLSLVTAFTASRWHIAVAGGIAAGISLLYLLIGIALFRHDIIIPLLYGPLAVLLTYISTISYHYIFEQKEKKKIRSAFKKYVSPIVIDDLLRHPEKLQLGGEKREITIFFSDIRGFTTLSEKLTPEQLVHVLNEYLTAMTNIILQHSGVVDKFIGDAIMAFWGAPIDQPEHASLACSTALDMILKLTQLQKKWEDEGLPHIRIGIGLNTGTAVVGNMGSYERFDYTAIGDNINLGSRLEGLTKQYGVDIIISESTQQSAQGFITLELDKVAVKGKHKPVTIFQLVGREGTINTKTVQSNTYFSNALQYYYTQEWTQAIATFQKSTHPSSALFIQRCSELMKNTPENWDGVWKHTSK